MTERDSVRFGDRTIAYEVRRSARRKKTVQITVDGGRVRVAAPSSTPVDELRAIVRQRAAWILKHAEHPAPGAAPKRFVTGETLPYLGRNVRMVVEAADIPSPAVRLANWRFRVSTPRGLVGVERTDRVREAVIEWYWGRAAVRLPALVDSWLPRFGRATRPRVLIRDQRRRWASCAPDGTLRFNWRTVMLPPSLIEYIVVHELSHLDVPNHSAGFWRRVSDAMPDAQQRRAQLKEAGRIIPL